MADKRRAAKEKTDRGIDAALRDLPRRGVQNPLLSTYLRKDAAKTAAGERFRKFREEDLATRYAKRAETSGLLDLLTLFPAGRAASALKAGERLPAALAGAEFLSQFSDDPVSRAVGDTLALAPTTRGLSKLAAGTKGAEFTKRLGQDWAGGTVGAGVGTLAGLNMRPEGRDGENLAAYPVYGVGSLRRLAAVADRVAKTGKDFPMFTAEGKMSPARQKELFRRMAEWIPNTSTKKPEAVFQDLRNWIAATKGAGKKPVEKRIMLDRMPASLSEAFQQTLKDLGYGGMDRGPRSKAPMDKFGTRVTKGQNLAALEAEGKYTSGGRMNPTQVATEGPKTWEELKPFEQGGGVPSGWASRNPGEQPRWVTRPGEVLEPGKKPFRSDLFKTATGAGLLGAALAGQDIGGEDSQAAVPGWKKSLRAPFVAEAQRALANRRRRELIPEKLYNAKYRPQILADLPSKDEVGPYGFFLDTILQDKKYFPGDKNAKNYEFTVNSIPKSGLTVKRPGPWEDPDSLHIDAASRTDIPGVAAGLWERVNHEKALKEYNQKRNISDSVLNARLRGELVPEYPYPSYPLGPTSPLSMKQSASPADISAASRILGAQFPEYENIGGYRVSGIRKGKAGKGAADTAVPLRKAKSEEERIRTLADSRRWLHELISERGRPGKAIGAGQSLSPDLDALAAMFSAAAR